MCGKGDDASNGNACGGGGGGGAKWSLSSPVCVSASPTVCSLESELNRAS